MIKKIKIIGTLIAISLTFPLHFLYEKIPNIITSIIAPVNESIFEHMKILFTAILLSGIIQKIYIKHKKLNINNVCISNFLAAISSIFIFLIMFLPYYYLFGKNFIITIIMMIISIILSEVIAYRIILKKDLKLENKTIIFTIIIYCIFAYLTFNPPHINFFIDPLTNLYGIKK